LDFLHGLDAFDKVLSKYQTTTPELFVCICDAHSLTLAWWKCLSSRVLAIAFQRVATESFETSQESFPDTRHALSNLPPRGVPLSLQRQVAQRQAKRQFSQGGLLRRKKRGHGAR
jgi:hypothetical protein